MPLPQDLTTHEMCSLLIIQKSEGTLKWLWTLTGKANGWFSLIPGVHCSVPRRFGNIKSAVVGKVLLFSVQAGEHQCCKMCAINKHQRVFPSFGWHHIHNMASYDHHYHISTHRKQSIPCCLAVCRPWQSFEQPAYVFGVHTHHVVAVCHS